MGTGMIAGIPSPGHGATDVRNFRLDVGAPETQVSGAELALTDRLAQIREEGFRI